MSFFAELKRRNVIRVATAYFAASWLIIQVMGTIIRAFGFGNVALRIVLIMIVIGLVPTLVFAWVFDLTPEGLRKAKDADRLGSMSPRAGKRLDRIIMVVLALALGYFAFDKFVLSESRQASIAESARQEGRSEALVEAYGDQSIAVLPFVNVSSDIEQEYFSDGISEDLLNLLAKIPELRVISRSSAFKYKGKDVDLVDVARELNVAYILEGSVRKSGNQLRITTQLIDAHSDTQLWSGTFDRTLDNIFAIQDEIAVEVVEQLQTTLVNSVPAVRETDPEAYTLFLQARHMGRQFTPEALEQSNALLQQALTIVPRYAEAWGELAGNYANQAGDGLRPLEEGVTLAREAAHMALAIDPDYVSALASLGWLAMRFDNDLTEAAQHIERALQLEPTRIDVLSSAASLVERLGRLDEAILLAEYVVSRDPVSAGDHANLGVYRLYAGRVDEAIASYRTALRLSPGLFSAHYAIGVALLLKGEPAEALAAFEQETDDEYRIKGSALAHYELGQTAEYAEAFTVLRERWGDEWPAEVAHVYAWVGDVDTAFDWIRRDLMSGHGEGWAESALDPLLANLHSDPRWQPLLAEIGISARQLVAIKFEVELPE